MKVNTKKSKKAASNTVNFSHVKENPGVYRYDDYSYMISLEGGCVLFFEESMEVLEMARNDCWNNNDKFEPLPNAAITIGIDDDP